MMEEFAAKANLVKGLCLAGLLTWPVMSFGLAIDHVESELRDDELIIKSEVGIQLSPEVIEALQAGIPIKFKIEVRVYHKRNALWDKRIAKQSFGCQVSHRQFPISYLVQSGNPPKSSVHKRLSDALEKMGSLQIYQVSLPGGTQLSSEELRGTIRLKLDRTDFSGALRMKAFFQGTWDLQTDWHRFDVQ